MKNENNLPTLLLKKMVHRNKIVLAAFFGFHPPIINVFRRIDGFTFSKTLRAWVVSFSEEKLQEVKQKVTDFAFVTEDVSLEKPIFEKGVRNQRVISEEHKTLIRNYVKYLQGKRYSESTVRTYFTAIADFFDYLKGKEVSTINNRDIELFLEDVYVPKKMSISTQRQFIGAVKLFVKFCPETHINDIALERPKKSKYLPTVLSKEEVIDLIRSTKNLKHRAIIVLLYSCGLRIGELLQLKLKDIDIDRRQLVVKSGKGRKDRYVVLANSFLPLLKNYFLSYRPELYFVEGVDKNTAYSASSIRKFLNRSKVAAKITKQITPHTLRHSYATHLLENGIGLRHIQELLGHAKPETTMIYTHVAKKDLLDIESPLDSILLSLDKNANQEQKFLLSRKINE